MDMESEDPLLASRWAVLRKAADFGLDDHAFVGLEKSYYAGNFRAVLAARDIGKRLRSAAQDRRKLGSERTAGGGSVHVNYLL